MIVDKIAVNMLKAETLDRIEDAKSRFKGDFVKRDNFGNIEEIHCRSCGTLVAGWIPGTQNDSSTTEKLQFKHLGNFRMIQLKLSDGSGYRTNMCADCVNTFDFSDPTLREELFASDIVAWARAAKSSGTSAEDHQKQFERIHALSVDNVSPHKIQTPGGNS